MQRHPSGDPSPTPAPAPADEPPAASKACDNCRIKKVRCDRRMPCANCRLRNARCTKSPRVARPRRRQEPTSTEYAQKIGLLERQLRQARTSGATSASTNAELPSAAPRRRHVSDHRTSPNSTYSVTSNGRQSSRRTATEVYQSQQSATSSSQTHPGVREATEQTDEAGVLLEGPTSLSAHSTMAISLLDKVAGADGQGQYNVETQELVGSLRKIVKAIKTQHVLARSLSTSARQLGHQKPDGFDMPPIKASVAAIRHVQERRDVMSQFMDTLLPSQPLSDICLRVYFSDDYSDADFIIINTALCYFFDELITSQQDVVSPTSASEYKSSCQRNLETAISRLPLHIAPSHDMILALVLGAIYSVETLKPHWAWTLVTSAYQAAYALGCHLKRSSGVERWCDASNPSGLLFWVIYYLEKTLCLRLGRCSTIPDGEITVMMPGGSPGLDYARSMVKLARLAGQVYEKLYGAQALAAYDAQVRLPVQELSQELNAISLQSQEAIRAWRGCTTAPDWCMLIDFLSASDRVLLHSMQTLIHRTDPAHGNSSTSFTEACILSARQTLACHQSCPVVLEGVQSAFLTSYLSWFIFLRPFVPFIVLFCHVVETGDRGDLQRMKQFADSMRSLMPGNSDAATRHQRLFQVFYDVAQRYVDLKSASAPAPYDQDGIQLGVGEDGGGGDGSNEIDSCLGAIGLYPHLALNEASTAADPSSFLAPDPDPNEFQVGAGTGPAPHLPYWFQVSQQMMEMMDNDQISF